jgi:PKD repeat protein
VAFTVQPTGTRFDPPAAVTLPNVGLPPGTEVDLFSFDHDVGEFLSVGTATVTADGLLLRSNPGLGISKAGWGGAVPPPPPNANTCHPGSCTTCVDGKPVSKCSPCQTCTGGTCKDMTIDEVKASADGKDDKRIQAKDEAVQFLAVAKGTCTKLEYEWDFGDPQSSGNTAQGQGVSHAFQKPGAYTVKVTAKCGGDCTNGATKTDDVKVAIVKVDLRVQTLPEEDQGPPNEEDPGTVLGVRDDGKPKYRAPVQVVFEGPEVDAGELKLSAPGGGTKVRIFQDAGGNSQVPLPKIWPISNGGMTESLFLEAVQPSDSVKDLELSLEYTFEDVSATDSAKATALAIDVRVDSDNDGSITDNDDHIEKQVPGRIVLANDDDDNNNNTVDRQESSTVAGEDDLVEMKLTLKPSNPTGLTGLKLEISPSAELRVWKDSSKGTAVGPGTVLAIGTDQIPDTLWLEGAQPGQGKVELTLRNDKGDVISDDLVQVVVARVEDVDVHGTDAETFKTPSAQQPPTINTKPHFVTAWKQNDIVLVARIMPDLPEIRQKVKWGTTGGVALTSPGVGTDELTTRLSSNVGQGVKVPITIKIADKIAKEAVAWVVSADVSGILSAPVGTPIITQGLRVGTRVESEYHLTAVIYPPEIITEVDRPDLSGGNPVPAPGGNNPCGDALSGGATLRWDLSRRIAVRASTIPSGLPLGCPDTARNYPVDTVIGNDDAGVFDEDNDPYSAPDLGRLAGVDKPFREGPGGGLLMHGNVGDTYTSQLWFEEFARLQLGAGAGGGWFVISMPSLRRVDFRFTKIQVTEALWGMDLDGDGQLLSDVTEAMGQNPFDANGDGDTNDNVGFWDNDGSSAAQDNAGKP